MAGPLNRNIPVLAGRCALALAQKSIQSIAQAHSRMGRVDDIIDIAPRCSHIGIRKASLVLFVFYPFAWWLDRGPLRSLF